MHRYLRRTALALAASILALGAMAGVAAANPTASASKANRVDRAFVRQMVPHHEMAVDMARMARMQGEHAEIKQVSAAIIRGQNAEIRQLRAIAKRLDVTPGSMHGGHTQMMKDADALGLDMDEMGMSMDMDELDGAKPFDRAFIDAMIPHHQGAIRMARAEIAKGKQRKLRRIARAIVKAQAKEIRQMNAWRTAWYGAASPAGGVPKS